MDKDLKAELEVNNLPIQLTSFAEQFLARTVSGAVSSLKGAEDIRSLELHLEQGNIKLTVNGKALPVTPFPKDAITNTVMGVVSSLKGVDKIDSVKINVRAE